MKKFAGVLLSIVMLFTVSACGSKINDDALDAFEEAIINLTKIESTDFIVEVKQSSGEADATINIDGTFINKNKNPQAMIRMNSELTNENSDSAISMYLDQGSIYVNFANIVKQKKAVDLSLITSASSATIKKGTLKTSGIKKQLKSAKLKDGNITLEFDTKTLKDVMKETIEKDSSGIMSGYKDFEFEKLDLEMNVNDGIMEKVIVKMNMKLEDQKADITFTLSFKNMNKAKDITFPDFSEYVESSSTNPLLGL